MFHDNGHQASETTPFVLPDAAGLTRLWAACMAEREEPNAETLRAYVASHRLVWDMPSLWEIYPEIVEHLEARYLARHHDGTITISFADDRGPETFEIDDVRHVVDILLSREYREALWRERVVPSFDRLVG